MLSNSLLDQVYRHKASFGSLLGYFPIRGPRMLYFDALGQALGRVLESFWSLLEARRAFVECVEIDASLKQHHTCSVVWGVVFWHIFVSCAALDSVDS